MDFVPKLERYMSKDCPLNPVAQNVAATRYFKKGEDGKPIEDWSGLVHRVVSSICGHESEEYQKAVYELIYETKFLPNSPCLVNAGNHVGGSLACFVTKAPEDSWLGMCENIANFGHVARRGGGCGVDFSKIRPNGSNVFGSTHFKACGPIHHMIVVSEAMNSITQAGFRGMACATFDTKVSTEHGLMQIGDIVEKQLIGTKIHTQFGETVITKAWHNGTKEVFEIITEHGYKVKLTGDHLIYVIDSNGNVKDGKWKKVQDLDLSTDSIIVNLDEKPFGKNLQRTMDEIVIDENKASMLASSSFSVPKEIFLSPKPVVSSFLRTAFDSKGKVASGKIIILETTNTDFAEGVQSLLGMFGIQSCTEKSTITISDKLSICKFNKEIGFTDRSGQIIKYNAFEGTEETNTVNRIKSISSLGDQEVYDISTENETFLANHIVVHNCMGVLRVDHPDILSFIVCKQRDFALKYMLKEDFFGHFSKIKGKTHDHANILLDKFISNFNISVLATNEFMNAVENDSDFDLKFDGKVYQTVKARTIFDLIVNNAWNNGDPGMLFYEAMNSGPYKYSGQDITATNPCFHGDSMVAVADGRNFVSIKQLAEEVVDVPVYCCNPENGDIHIKWGRNPRKTKDNAPLTKVTFSDGGSVITTPDHKILLRNGEYKEVQHLQPGDSVMPMTKFEYISHRSKYLGIVKGDGQSTKSEHRMIYEFHNEELAKEEIIHHIDFNGANNKISNLQKMSLSDHSAYHRQFNNPMTHWYPNATPEEKQRYHENMSKATSGEKNGMFNKSHSDESKKLIGDKTKERSQDGQYIERLTQSMRTAWSDDERRKKQSNAKKEHWEAGAYDGLKAEIVTKACDWCGKDFQQKSFSKVRFCSTKCGNQIDVTDEQIIQNALLFAEKNNCYPTVALWENFEEAVGSRELVRKRFGNFQALSEKLVERGCFANLAPNCKMTPVLIAAAIVAWTIKSGKQPSKKELQTICSKNSISRNGGYDKLIDMANDLCKAQNVNHKVVSVEMLSETDDVYNITVDDHHNLCILSSSVEKHPHSKYYKGKMLVSRYSTIVYKNCGEQMLPSFGSCNLGSIDVSKFYDKSTNDLDWNSLRNAIRTSFQFLDNVIDVNKFPTQDFADWAIKNRPVGLGIMGWADLLLKMKIPYGEQSSLDKARELCKFFQDVSHEKSVELAQERGTCEAADYEEIDHRRNVTTLSIAPTGTISLLAGCSSSVEPIYAPVTYRADNTGHYKMPHPESGEDYFRCAVDKEQNGKREVPWQMHVDMQAAFQEFVDSGISKCITGNSLLLTKNGFERISDLDSNRIFDSFSPLAAEVFSEKSFESATEFYYGGVRKTIKVETQNGFRITGTPNHRIKVMLPDGKIDFVRLDELKTGQYCVMPWNTQIFGDIVKLPEFEERKFGNYKHVRFPEKLSSELSYLLGLITAEGCYQAENAVAITHSDPKVLEEARHIFEKEFDISGSIVLDKRTDSVYKLGVNSRNLVRWMQEVADIRRGAYNKVIPGIILKSTQENIFSFLSGLFFDGYVSVSKKGTKLGICLASESIIRDLQVVLMNMGVISNVIRKWDDVYKKYFCELSVYGDGLELLGSKLEMREEWKRSALEKFRTNRPNEYHLGCPKDATLIVENIIKSSSRSMNSFLDQTGSYRVKSAIHRTGSMKRADIQSAINFFAGDEISKSASAVNLLQSLNDFDNCIYQEIVSIEESQDEVFDIYVPKGNTFFASGFINHNTINCPSSATKDDIAQAYMRAWRNGCKGVTIYRDGSKTTQVLSSEDSASNYSSSQARKRPKTIPCDIYRTTAEGLHWHIIVGLDAGQPYEIFAVNGSLGELPDKGQVAKRKKRHYSLLNEAGEVLIDNLNDAEEEIDPRLGLETRRFSLELRHGIPPKYIVEQIVKSSDKITSFSKAVGRILKKNYISNDDIVSIAEDKFCENCAKKGEQVEMKPESGCMSCPTCFHSRCG